MWLHNFCAIKTFQKATVLAKLGLKSLLQGTNGLAYYKNSEIKDKNVFITLAAEINLKKDIVRNLQSFEIS